MKSKILIFVVGLVAGVTLGVLFSVAIKELIVQFKELHLSLNKINVKQNELSQRLDSIQGKLIPDAKKTSAPPSQANSKTTTPAVVKTPSSPENSRTLNQKTSNIAQQDSDVVVMTNQLVSVLSVPLKNRDTVKLNKKTQETDSTLSNMSDVGNTKEPLQYRVEFWKSPLNYKGYKMSKGKIVLYGINPVSPVNLMVQESNYYLLVNQSAYKVEYTDDYKPFERITDKATLKKVGL